MQEYHLPQKFHFLIGYDVIWVMLYLITEIGLTTGGSSAVHIYTQTVHRTTQSTRTINKNNKPKIQYIEQHNRQKPYNEQLNRQNNYIEQHNRQKYYIENTLDKNGIWNNIIHWLGRVRTVSIFAREKQRQTLMALYSIMWESTGYGGGIP